MSQKTVLIVEESYDISLITSKIFKLQKWNVIKSSTGEEALSFLISNTPDVILMDIRLPTMSGFECCEIIRNFEDKLKSNIPIIAITANVHNLNLEEYKDKGFSYFFQKPVDFELLLKKINQLLS